MRRLQPIARVLFGAWFLFAGLNYWVQIVPQPYGAQPLAREFIAVLVATGLFGVVKAIEILVGVFVLLNRLTALAVLAAVPISIVAAFHGGVLEHSIRSVAIASTLLVVHAALLLSYRHYYQSVLTWRPGT